MSSCKTAKAEQPANDMATYSAITVFYAPPSNLNKALIIMGSVCFPDALPIQGALNQSDCSIDKKDACHQ
jgi:hypothetical protein